MDSDKQRRWWFATHPEFSRKHRAIGPRREASGPRCLSGHPAADPNSNDQHEDVRDRTDALIAEEYKRMLEATEPGLIESHTALDVLPIGRSFRASELSFNWFLRRLGRGSVVYAR